MLEKFHQKINLIPKGMEKYDFYVRKQLRNNFIASMKLINSSLESLFKHLPKNKFKYLSQEFSEKQ